MSTQASFDPATGSRRETVTSTGLPGAKQLAVPGVPEGRKCGCYIKKTLWGIEDFYCKFHRPSGAGNAPHHPRQPEARTDSTQKS